jgi:hypothetical protein
VAFHHVAWVKTLDASVFERCLDVIAFKGPTHQAAAGNAVNSVGRGLRGSGCSGSGATISSWAKGKQLVVSPLTRVFSATARAHTEAPFDISYCDLEIGSRVDNVVDQHRGPQGGRITGFPFSSHYEVRRNELLRTVTTTPVLTACASSSSYQRQIATSPHHQLRRTSGVPARPQCLLLLQLDGSIGYRGLGVPPSQSAMQGERLAHEQAW